MRLAQVWGFAEWGRGITPRASHQVFRFVVNDAPSKLVTIHGDDLLRICDGISRRRTEWIRQADRDFRMASNGPIITTIDIA
jgi:hypothetical protein